MNKISGKHRSDKNRIIKRKKPGFSLCPKAVKTAYKNTEIGKKAKNAICCEPVKKNIVRPVKPWLLFP